MAANDILYKFEKSTPLEMTGEKGGATELISKVVSEQQHSDSAAKVPVPLGATGNIDIVNEFRWTKSALNSLAVKHTPTITLREMQVVSPAFFHNMTTLLNQIVGKNGIVPTVNNALRSLADQPPIGAAADAKSAANDATAARSKGINYGPEEQIQIEPKVNLITEFITSNQFIEWSGHLQENMKTVKGYFEDFKNGALRNTKYNWSSYLYEYENIYGVNPTNFLYRLPYLEDNYKQISTSWGNDTGGIVNSYISKASDLLKLASPAVGVDLAKSFNYPDAGPSHDVNFFLDNTVIDDVSHAAKNYRFIYLLLYQNLPNRINHSAITPPVIYQSSLPGVFSYRWSYLSKLTVNFIGARRPMKVQITDQGGADDKGITADVIMPEGFEVQLTITSLIPETKNLMYDSIDNPVSSEMEWTHSPAAAAAWVSENEASDPAAEATARSPGTAEQP